MSLLSGRGRLSFPLGLQTITTSVCLALLPSATLIAFWVFGETGLLVTALGLPLAISLLGPLQKEGLGSSRDPVTGLSPKYVLENALDHGLQETLRSSKSTICVCLQVDDFGASIDRFGVAAGDALLAAIADRLRSALRSEDTLSQLDGPRFAIAMAPLHRMDMEQALQVAKRLQGVVERPLPLDATTVCATASVGFALPSRLKVRTGQSYLDAAETALLVAKRAGPASIRAFSQEMAQARLAEDNLVAEVKAALENGEIRPWFQPQVSASTGQITGFEALARWEHPVRGLIPPKEFLPAIETAGLLSRLGEANLFHSLTALNAWDKAGHSVEQIGINFSAEELRNPKLVESISWELERFGVKPERLAIEILETVVANSDDDILTRNIAALAKLGCAIDLDDFGTGHASIANIRRFAVSRLKIDRSFVTRVDQDSDQQALIGAILSMAERLRLDTLAEGVQTVGEHAMLRKLGCGHVQGFGVAKPMPFEDTAPWMQAYRRKLTTAKTRNIAAQS